jgi:hypothetical protein
MGACSQRPWESRRILEGKMRMKKYDHYQTYCGSLGDCINFSYCRAAGGREPCGRILDCWIGRLPIVEFLKDNYTPDVLERVFAPPPSRLDRMMSAAQRAARNCASKSKS